MGCARLGLPQAPLWPWARVSKTQVTLNFLSAVRTTSLPGTLPDTPRPHGPSYRRRQGLVLSPPCRDFLRPAARMATVAVTCTVTSAASSLRT